ncbi:MAG: dihydrodipicolinate synthase family protein [Candidatus Tumulicola sp.]
MGDAKKGLRGNWAAVVTPVDAHLRPDAAKAIAYYRDLLDAGCDGINLLGTTGEAMSFGAAQRLQLMEAVARSGIPRCRAMAGTGAASLEDTTRLTRAALDLGFAAVLLMPPFFFRDATDDGVMRFFDALFARLPVANDRVLLYNFPQMSGITFHPDLVDRLIEAFPGAIAGLKDSSNDRALQAEILVRHPGLAVFPGSEEYLLDAVASGAAGCISGSVALWPQLARSVYLHPAPGDARRLAERRAVLAQLPFVAAVRYCIARNLGDDSWEQPVPPLMPLTPAQRSELDRRLAC